MTISRDTLQQQAPRSDAFPRVEQDGHTNMLRSLERETVRRDTASILAAETRRVREAAPTADTGRGLGSAVRILFGVIWLADAYFKWQLSFLNGLPEVIHDGTMGQPGWLMPWFTLTRAIIAVQPTVWAYGIAIVETGIAVALLVGFARKVTYLGGAIWSLLIWTTVEGFGHMSSGIATDIGRAIGYVVVFLALLALDQCNGTRRFSLDAVIERHLPWWRRIAEVGRGYTTQQ
jgi:thiosulfate dehydrogenase (quinone) large subunit